MKHLSYTSADEAVRGVRSGDHIHLSSIASVPHVLIDALCRRAGELRDLHFHHFHTEGPAPYGSPEYEGVFFDQGFFVGPNVRKSVQEGYADYLPAHLFESQAMYRSGVLPCDVAMVQVSEPVDGVVSLGTSVDCSIAALEVARLKLAVVNPNVPFSYGEPIPVERFDALVRDDTPLITKDYVEPTDIDRLIGSFLAFRVFGVVTRCLIVEVEHLECLSLVIVEFHLLCQAFCHTVVHFGGIHSLTLTTVSVLCHCGY